MKKRGKPLHKEKQDPRDGIYFFDVKQRCAAYLFTDLFVFFLVLSCLFFLAKSSLFLGLDFLRRNSGTQKERLFNCLKRKRREKKNVN